MHMLAVGVMAFLLLVAPQAGRRQPLYGSVKLFLVIDERGEVPHAEVVESIPDFDAAALDSAWKWKFTSTRALGGQAVPYSLLMPVSFRIY
jgi:TonB family protein